ncbi:MAG: hypothetical protein K5852_10555 [Eubacterium sp.]|nr:hypothetical protein [Eubacterium sp.]
MKQKLFVWIICTMMLVTLSVPVMADEAIASQPDYSRTGSITVDIHTSDKSQKPVPGATLTIYKVARAVGTEFEYTEGFIDCPSEYLKGEKGIGSNEPGEHEISAKLAAHALAKKIQPYGEQEVKLNSAGKAVAVFTGLDLGLYLVVQKSPANGYTNIAPFSVTVPGWNGKEYIYDVDAYPKPGVVTTITPKPSITPTPVKPPPLLPQTGQLWWPVALLIAVGAILLISGLVSEKRKKGTR